MYNNIIISIYSSFTITLMTVFENKCDYIYIYENNTHIALVLIESELPNYTRNIIVKHNSFTLFLI